MPELPELPIVVPIALLGVVALIRYLLDREPALPQRPYDWQRDE